MTLPQLLIDLEAQWRRLDAPIAMRLRPGLSDADLAAVGHRLGGVSLPTELRQLWAWHDGAEPGGRRDIGPGAYDFLTTDEVVAAHQRELRIQGTPVEADDSEVADMYWHRSWVPFMTQGPQRLYIDCARRTTTGLSPVRLVTWEWENHDVDRATSLTAAVSLWTWLLGCNYYHWGEGGVGKPIAYDDIPLFARLTLA
jgi:cell wall assembly regulator SMI1